MKKLLFILAITLVLGSIFTAQVIAEGPRKPFERAYDSIGVMLNNADAAADTHFCDTVTTWQHGTEFHNEDEAINIEYADMGGGLFSTLYLEVYPINTPHGDSTKAYVCIDQSLTGEHWIKVDSASVTTAATVVTKAITLLALPKLRYRTQGAANSADLTVCSLMVKSQLKK